MSSSFFVFDHNKLKSSTIISKNHEWSKIQTRIVARLFYFEKKIGEDGLCQKKIRTINFETKISPSLQKN